MSAIKYIGSFPPPYGGVTVKNLLLFEELALRLDIVPVNLTEVKAGGLRGGLRFARGMLSSGSPAVFALSDAWRRRVTRFVSLANRRLASRSLVFVMGGSDPRPGDVGTLNAFRRVYVETRGMKAAYEAAGIRNVSIYPNCRRRPATAPEILRERERERASLSCVYFSKISQAKGAGVVLDAAAVMPDVSFHFYGVVERSYEKEFASRVRNQHNVAYHGVFDACSSDPVAEMSRYDLHLLPTSCATEGVPGSIVESKLAGIPTIATKLRWIPDMVEDGINGILVDDADACALACAIRRYNMDRQLLSVASSAAWASARTYFVGSYIDGIVRDISEVVL